MWNRNDDMMQDDTQDHAAIRKALTYVDSFVHQKYLSCLTCNPVVKLASEKKQDALIRLFQMERIVYETDADIHEKLMRVYQALSHMEATGVLLIQSSSAGANLYLGCRFASEAQNAEAIFDKSLKANFVGSQFRGVPPKQVAAILDTIHQPTHLGLNPNVAALSFTPAWQDGQTTDFASGIETLLQTMRGVEYTAVFLAEPVPKRILEQRKRGLQRMYAGISPLAQTNIAFSQQQLASFATGFGACMEKMLQAGLPELTSTTQTENMEQHAFGCLGMDFLRGVGFDAGSAWAEKLLPAENGNAKNGQSDSRAVQTTTTNQAAVEILDTIRQQLQQIQQHEAHGFWDVACYFISESHDTVRLAASTCQAALAGTHGGSRASLNVWDQANIDHGAAVLEHLRYCMHPRFLLQGNEEFFPVYKQTVTPCCLVDGNALPAVLGLPRCSVAGVTSMQMAGFSREIHAVGDAAKGRKIRLGNVFHMGEKERSRVTLDLDTLRGHCLITGASGAGKSHTAYRILDELITQQIPFLVIEPTKGTYKRYYGNLPGIHVYCTNPHYYGMLQLNPFRFDTRLHVMEHLDALIEIFHACWPLSVSMSALLKEAFVRAYMTCGWDLENSIYLPNGHRKFPTFVDVLNALPDCAQTAVAAHDTQLATLMTHVKALTNGVAGQILCSPSDLDDEELFDQNTIIDLSRVASLEIKSLLMGLLMLKLHEHRLCVCEEHQPLRHVTVLENAQYILGCKSRDDGAQANAIEMLCSNIAEMGSYGEGFLLVTPAPTALHALVIQNTGTKIVLRLPDAADAGLMGVAMGLQEHQIRELSRLANQVAAVSQPQWDAPVLTMVDRCDEQYYQDDLITNEDALASLKGKLAVEIVVQYVSGLAEADGFQLDDLLDIIHGSEVNPAKQRDFGMQMVDLCTFFEEEPLQNGNLAAKLSELIRCDGLFEAFPLQLTKDYSREPVITRDCLDYHDLLAIRQWFEQIYRHFNRYAWISDDNMKKNVLRFLLLHKRCTAHQNNQYHLIYEGLYGKTNGA